MRIDNFGQLIFSEGDLCDVFLSNPDKILGPTLVDTQINFNDLNLSYIPNIILYKDPKTTIQEFDIRNQTNWHMPVEYKEMDIAKFILEQCTNDQELQRAGQELLLFQDHNAFDLLRYLKYLVDTMRKNNIVWGVGRGSSVASFVLYLLGVHKINSLYYDLPIEEFIK